MPDFQCRTPKPNDNRLAGRASVIGHAFAICPGSLVVGLVISLPLAALTQSSPPKSEPGLAVTYTSLRGSESEMASAPNVWLFVEAGHTPSPLLPAGPFSATWEGTLSAELRSEFFFQAELNGSFKLEMNGATVLEAQSAGGASPLSKAVQLRKGTNVLKATFTSPAEGDAYVRLGWTERGTNTGPIPLPLLNHAPSAELQKAAQLRLGRELFLEYRCARCHAESSGGAGAPELKIDAPSFEGIGARRNYEWMGRWILSPNSLRPDTHMPELVQASTAKEDSEAMAAFLASLADNGVGALSASTSKDNGEPNKLFEKLQCSVCHDAPDTQEIDPKKIPLKHVAEKFAPGKLEEFLRAPQAHFTWTRMPDFRLNASEANALANSLIAAAGKPKQTPPANDTTTLERGKRLVQESGCLNCHSLKLENRFSAPTLAALPTQWTRGCLAAAPSATAKAPRYNFSAEERMALEVFGQSDRLSLARHVPAEFAERQTRLLNCRGCHGQLEMVPAIDILGGKLKPEWASKFIGGEIAYKPRAETHPRGEPWLAARMPAFKSRAKFLAEGLAAQHGVSPRTPPEGPVRLELASIGRKLVGKEGGFSCISCHGIGAMEASEVVESEGINLAHAADRLLPAYYRRWLRNPLSIDPQTKMPLYFDEGKSPLTETLDGDAEQQIEAIWQYIRLGDKMSPPP